MAQLAARLCSRLDQTYGRRAVERAAHALDAVEPKPLEHRASVRARAGSKASTSWWGEGTSSRDPLRGGAAGCFRGRACLP